MSTSNVHPPHVLVVDDDRIARNAIRNVLTMYGWSVVVAADEAEALAATRGGGAFDLIILDLVLGRSMGGLALGDLLHRLQPNAAFLFVSGKIESGIPEETMPGVPKDFLGKPFSVSVLIDKATALLRQNPPASPLR